MRPPVAVSSGLGPVVSVGSHILDVLGRPVTEIPPGQGSATLEEIRATAAGTAAGTSVDLAHLGVAVQTFGAVGDDALGDLLVMLMERAGVLVTPFRHDAGSDQELVDPGFAEGLRELCDATGAALILDDVRCGFRLHIGGSWEPIGVEPDLSAWSKAIANGYPLAAVLGNERFRQAADSVFTTGSFWFAAVPMAASLATIEALRAEGAVEHMVEMGSALRDGIEAQAGDWGVEVRQTGPVQMPYLSFAGDQRHALADRFCAEALRRGAFIHPRHNWFVSAAMNDDDLQVVITATDQAFAAVRKHIQS